MLGVDASGVKELADRTTDWCVSAFVPAHDVVGKKGGDSLVLKNLLRDAGSELLELGVRRSEVDELFGSAVPDEVADPGSEVFHKAGIAVFAAPGFHRSYRLTHDTPPLVTVARRFHLKPLLHELHTKQSFFVLGLTRGHALLHVGDADGLQPVDVPGMPASLDDAIQYDDRERILLSHSSSRRGMGGVVAAFHGQGARGDHLSEDVMRYLRMVDGSLKGVVGDDEAMVLAGSRDMVAAYRSMSSQGMLPAQDIFGNSEVMASTELHARALEIVAATASRDADDAAKFLELHGTGKASNVPTTVFTATRHGRVATLFVAADTQSWGRFDPDAEAPELHAERVAGDEDLLDTAAVEAWSTGATVHVVAGQEVPGGGELAAIVRY